MIPRRHVFRQGLGRLIPLGATKAVTVELVGRAASTTVGIAT